MYKKTAIDILIGAPGCGKTTLMLDEVVTSPGRYLFSLPRIDLIEEVKCDLHAKAQAAGKRITTVAIHSQNGSPARVHRQVADAARDHAHEEHVVVLITHETLVISDLTGYAGWHVRIDEVPDAIASGSFRVPAGYRFFEATYDLEPVPETNWHRVVLRDDAPDVGAFLKDDFMRDLVVFHRRAASPQGVYVDIANWDDASDGRREVRWWSVWTPAELCDFRTATIAGAGFFQSVCYLATRHCHRGQAFFQPKVIGGQRTAVPQVRVGYFAKAHVGSTKFWASPLGEECLVKVSRYLEALKHLGYWSANKSVRSYFVGRAPGHEVSPKIAGTNEYRDLTSCAYIYSNKAQKSDDTILEVFGLSKADIERARQTEDLIQFAMRGAIRCPDFGGSYEVYVYDETQAQALERYLRGNGFSDVTISGIEGAGIMDVERPKRGPKPPTGSKTLAEREAARLERDRVRKRRKRTAEKQAKIAEGTYRGRGRPPKSASQQPTP